MRVFVLLVALIATPVWGQELTLPEKVKGRPGQFIQVPATTKSEAVGWYVPDAGLELFPVNLLKDSKTAVVTANAPGTYRIVAFINPTTPVVVTTVVIEGVVPPKPVPPNPDPQPVDPLTASAQAAYGADSDPNKAHSLKQLIALYTQVSRSVPQAITWQVMRDQVMEAAKTLGVSGRLQAVQGLIADEIFAKEFPSDLTLALDDAGRQKAAKAFARAAKVLEGIQP